MDGTTDGNFFNGSVTHTNEEAAPWWQIDLGSSHVISKIRLWNRTDCCSSRLSDYFVFVSDTDFRSISNDPIVLAADSRVRTYTYTLSGLTTTFLTLDNALNPIQGRYVRVQLKDTGTARALSLAEVQVFGPNHVEPDRYPVDVRDTNLNDGYLEVKVYNPNTLSYQWVKQRGKLLWNGAADGVLNGTTIGPGNVTREWSLQQDSSTHQATAESFGQSARVGVEIEVEAGLIAKVQAGAGYEYSSGLTTEYASLPDLSRGSHQRQLPGRKRLLHGPDRGLGLLTPPCPLRGGSREDGGAGAGVVLCHLDSAHQSGNELPHAFNAP